ncbi:Putative cytosolic protein [Giardia duodenalis]|uniref:Putative cytosolic protein n=1 Tax=Giardia intestinalis TaxID=5741 RepID=V6TAE2_GIAIN|nr:Putative cytosolic protein [Giardia intestinalis]
MPLLNGFPLTPVTETIQATSSSLFSILLTNDCFSSYSDYITRVRQLQSPLFQCVTTMTTGLSYPEALTSELRAIHTIRRLPSFIILHFIPLLVNKAMSSYLLPLLLLPAGENATIDESKRRYFCQIKELYHECLHNLPFVGEPVLLSNKRIGIVVHGSNLFSAAFESPQGQQATLNCSSAEYCVAVEISGSWAISYMRDVESVLGHQLKDVIDSLDEPCFTYTDEDSGLDLYILKEGSYARYTVTYDDGDASLFDSPSVYPLTASQFEYLCLLLRYFFNSKGAISPEVYQKLLTLVDHINLKIGAVKQSVQAQLNKCTDIKDIKSVFSSKGLDTTGILELYMYILDVHATIQPVLTTFQTDWLFDSWNRAIHTLYPLRPDNNLLELIADRNMFKSQVMGANVSVVGKVSSYEIDGQKFFIDDSLALCEGERRIPIRISFVPDPHGAGLKKYLDTKNKIKRQDNTSSSQDESESIDILVTPSRRDSSGRGSRDPTGKKNTAPSTKPVHGEQDNTNDNDDNDGPYDSAVMDTATSSGAKRSGEKTKGKRAPNGCRTINGEIVRLKDQVTMEVQPECMQLQSRIMLKDDMDIIDCPHNESKRAAILLHEPLDRLVSNVDDSDYEDITELSAMFKTADKTSGLCQILYPRGEDIQALYTSVKDMPSHLFQLKYKYTRPPDTPLYAPFRDDSINKDSISMSLLMTVWAFLQANTLFLKLPFISLEDFSDALDVTDQFGYKRQLQYRSLAPEELKQAEEEDIKEYYFEKYHLTDKKDQLASTFPVFNGDLISPILYLVMSRLVSLLYDGEEEIVDEVPYEYTRKTSLVRRTTSSTSSTSSTTSATAVRAATAADAISRSPTESAGSATEISTAHENVSSDDLSSDADNKQSQEGTKSTEYSYYETEYSSTEDDIHEQLEKKKPPPKAVKKSPKSTSNVSVRVSGQANSRTPRKGPASNSIKSKRNTQVSDDSADEYSGEYSYTDYTYSDGEEGTSYSTTDNVGSSQRSDQRTTGKRRIANAKEGSGRSGRLSTRSEDQGSENRTEGYYCSTDISYTDEWDDIDGSKDTYWYDQALRYLLSRINESDRFTVILRILPIFFKLKIKYHKQLEKVASNLLRAILSAMSTDNLLAAILNECINPIRSYSNEEKQEAIEFVRQIALSREERAKEREAITVRQKGKRTLRMSKSSKYRSNSAQIAFKDSLADFFVLLQELSAYGKTIEQQQELQTFPHDADDYGITDIDQTAEEDQETNTIDYKPPTSVGSGQDTAPEEPKLKRIRAKDRFLEYMPHVPSALLSIAPSLHMSVCIIASYILENVYFILFLKRLLQYLHFSRAKQRPADYTPSHIRFHQLSVQEKLELLNYFIHQVSETENYHIYQAQEQSYSDSIESMSKELESALCLHFLKTRRETRKHELDGHKHKYEEKLNEARDLCLEKAKIVNTKWKEFAELIGVTTKKLIDANLVFEELDADGLNALSVNDPVAYQKYAGFQTPEHVDTLKKLMDTKGGTVTLANQQIRGFNMHLIRAIGSCTSALNKYRELKRVAISNQKFNHLYHERLDYQQFKALHIMINTEMDNKMCALDTADIHTDWYMNQFFLLPAEYGYLTTADLNYMVMFSDAFMKHNELSYKFRMLSHRQMLRYADQLGATPREKMLKEWVKQMDGLIANYRLSTAVKSIIRKMNTATHGYETIQKIIGTTDIDTVNRWMAEYEERREKSGVDSAQKTEKYTTERIMKRMEQMGVPNFSTKRAYLTSIAGTLRLSHHGIHSFLKHDASTL